MVSGCVTSLTNGWSEMVTGLCEADGKRTPGETCLGVFLGCYSRVGVAKGGGVHKGSNSSSVFVGIL